MTVAAREEVGSHGRRHKQGALSVQPEGSDKKGIGVDDSFILFSVGLPGAWSLLHNAGETNI